MTSPKINSVEEIKSSMNCGGHWDPPSENSDAASSSVVERESDILKDCPLTSTPTRKRKEPLFDMETALPPQLHPAVSMGMRRISSRLGSGSINSKASSNVADLLSLWDDSAGGPGSCNSSAEISTGFKNDTALQGEDWTEPPSNLLYHDILMNVFTFLDTKSLAAFSETARRPNFECFYFLQLQLQRALLVHEGLDNSNSDNTDASPVSNDPVSAIAGVGAISRLAALDRSLAEETVQQFLDSNSTLSTGTMPLSHSLVYIRHLLRRSGFDEQSMTNAALFTTAVGAASFVGTDAAISIGALSSSFGSELPNMLFRVGFVGSLMRAARIISNSDPAVSLQKRAKATLHAAYCAAYGYESSSSSTSCQTHLVDLDAVSEIGSLEGSEELQQSPESPNPYEHVLPSGNEGDRKLPSGCVGAFVRAVARARKDVPSIFKERRRKKYYSLPVEERQQLATFFIDACRSDDSYDVVRDLVQVQETIDVDGVYIDSDGIETCALHTSALHGSCKILDFLCRGIDESDPSNDGALCDVNVTDGENGWTAMHFAVAAYSVDAVRTLADHGADISIKAHNGCTALEWACRLKSEEVVEELSLREALVEVQNQEQKEKMLAEETDMFNCESLLCAHHESLKKMFEGRLHKLEFRIA